MKNDPDSGDSIYEPTNKKACMEVKVKAWDLGA